VTSERYGPIYCEHAGHYEVLGIIKAEAGQWMHERDGLVPALAIPVQSKNSFECTDPHLEALRGYIQRTTRVITIGWRGVERHFLDLWTNRNDFFDLMVISGTEEWGQETLSNMRSGKTTKDAIDYRREVFDGGFGEALGSGSLSSFLESSYEGDTGEKT
jgi:hypothetical protein